MTTVTVDHEPGSATDEIDLVSEVTAELEHEHDITDGGHTHTAALHSHTASESGHQHSVEQHPTMGIYFYERIDNSNFA